ncbi:MAG: hypothetical protein V1857_07190 [archaeon]
MYTPAGEEGEVIIVQVLAKEGLPEGRLNEAGTLEGRPNTERLTT